MDYSSVKNLRYIILAYMYDKSLTYLEKMLKNMDIRDKSI
jgi:hypothetical protein